MAYKRKTWQEKLHNGHPDKVEVVDKKFGDVPEGATMYIATPGIVDAYIRNIPAGRHTSLQQMRKDLAARGARANVKPMAHRLKPPHFNKRLYRKRNLVERFFNKLKHFRAVATRYDKRDDNYLACVKLASIRIWMRFNESMT